MADDIRFARATPKEANTFTQSIFQPSQSYSFPATSITRKDLHKIQAPYVRAILNKMHYPRNFPLAMTHGPKGRGGKGIAHLYAKQGTLKTMAMIRNYRRPAGLLPDSIKIAHSWVHLFAGTRYSPLQDTKTNMPHLIKGWFSDLKNSLQQSNCSLWFPEQVVKQIKPRREQDRVLMDDLCRSGLNDTDVEQLNFVRLYLKAKTVSDLCNVQGTHLSTNALHRQSAKATTSSPKQWPVQKLPGERQFAKWRRYIRLRYCTTRRSNQLAQPMGKWLPNHQDSVWPAYYNTRTDEISIENNGYWHTNRVTRTKYGGLIIQDHTALHATPPPDSIPTEVHINGQWCMIPDHFVIPKPPKPPINQPKTFQEYIRQLPEWEQQLFQEFQEVDSTGQQLIQLLSTQDGLDSLIVGSDGGAMPHGRFKGYGSLGWCFCTKNRILWKGKGPVRGHPDNPSFRTEAYAVLTFLRFILHQYRFWKVEIPNARINGHTDSLSLIKTLAKIARFANDWYSTVYTWSHIDILREINNTLQELHPLVYIPQHVKAHADKKKKWHELSREEQVNVYCDREATSALRQQMAEPHKRHAFLPLPGMSTYLKHNDKFVTGHEQKILLWATAENEITDYYSKKYEWSRTTAKTIDWAAFEAAQNGTPWEQFLPKLCCSWLPTNYHLNKREGIPDECPLCQQSETTDPLFACPKRRAQRKLFLIQFQGLLIDLRTDPKIQKELVSGIKQLVRTTDEPTDNKNDNQPVSQFPAAQQ